MSLRPSSGTKKLKKFFLEKTTPAKRIKALSGFIVSAAKEECQSFFAENNDSIIALINEQFSECESAPKPVRKGKHYTTDFIALLHLLKKYIEVCPLDKPQFVNDIYEMLRKILGYGNKHAIRSNGYEILLATIEILHLSKQQYSQFLPMLADGINFIPFYPEDQPSTPPQIFHPKALAPATTMPSIEEAVELWDYFCDCMAAKEENFGFWLELFKREYLPTLFPSIAKKLQIISANEIKENAFKECPPQLQKILSTHVTIWTESNSSITTTIWKPPHGQMLLDICKQNCQLPVEYSETTTLIIEKFKRFILEKIPNNSNLLEEIGGTQQLQIYIREFIQNISLVFLTKSTPETLEIHYQLGQKVLGIYKLFTVELSSLIDQTTWTCLQDTILKLVVDVLGGSNPYSINHISTISANEIFQHLFIIWIRSPFTTKEMWVQLSDKLSKMVQWGELLNQWKDKILQLTHIMVELFFENKIKIKEAEEQRKQSRQLRTMTDANTLRNQVITIDFSFSNKQSDQQKVKDLWFTLLHILGNLNAIANPDNFQTALSCCADVIDIIFATEDRFEVDCTKIIEVYHIFLPWLLEACLVEEKRNRGRLVAFSTLCKLFCRPQSSSLPTEILCHFYRTIRQGLNSNHSSVIWSIIRNTTSIFTICLPGVNILIPDFLREISKLVSSTKAGIPADVQLKALTILSSLICFPNHFNGVTYSYREDDEEKELTIELFRDKISSIFLTALQNEKLSAPNISYLQYALSVLIMNDLHYAPRKSTIRECVKGILFSCMNAEKRVALSAIESLSSLKECYTQLMSLDASLISVLVYTLAENVNNLIRQCKQELTIIPEKEDVIVNHFYCLLDWLLVSDIKIIDYACLLEVFEAVELGLLGEALSSVNETSTTKEPQKKKNLFDIISKSRVKKMASTILDNAANDHATHFSMKIREAAEIFLLHLLVKYNNFPAPEGATDGPPGCDGDDESTLYFIYNHKSIFSFKEMINPENGQKFVRVVIRDGTGKYTWDTELLTQLDFHSIQPNDENKIAVKSNVQSTHLHENQIKKSSVYRRAAKETPFFKDGQNVEGVDMANELLKYLEEAHPQLIPSGQEFQDKNILKIKKFNELVIQQEEGENNQIQQFDNHSRTPLPLLPEIQTPISSFQYCRLLISHFGYISESSRRVMSFLTSSSRLKRSLKELDKINSRDMVKIGVLYVKEGQDHQNQILANEIASERYTNFVNGLGWSVNLSTHKAYRGGLDSRSAGASAVYYADPLYEVIFHDITRMPSTKDDLQQIQKKRHVGNDNVQIIWSEHYRDYDPSTITSQFNDAHIIIYPLDNGLHRVQIYQKEKLQSFGPLQSGMLVTKKLLPLLVRITSINANTACRMTSDLYRKPYSLRLDLINEITRRYKCEKLFSEYISELIPSPNTLNLNNGSIILDDDAKEEIQISESPPTGNAFSAAAPTTFGGSGFPTTRPKSTTRARININK